MLEALRQIDDRARHEASAGEPWRGESPAAETPAAENAVAAEAPPAASDPIGPVKLERAEARLMESLRERRFDQRYYLLAEAILPQVIGDRRAVLLFTGAAGDDPQGGRLVDLYAVLAEQTLGETVVVDCDSRRPGIGQRLSLSASVGLPDVVAGRATWRVALCRTEHAGLSILPHGSGENAGPVRTLDLLTLVDELRRSFQLVILDGTRENDADVASLAGICDGTYLIVALDHTPRRSVEQTLHAIRQRGGRALGCVALES
ncbi:MAG: hypothetical protein JW809_05295 [Pirellulales bacterium]|nr:hypothetical protein [Pirellulales bacterium]